jgi:hypothetical protein
MSTNFFKSKTSRDVEIQEDLLVDYIVGSYLPLSTAENPRFRKLIESHNPAAKHVSRENVRNAIILKAAALRRVCSNILSSKCVSITTDCCQ